MGKKRNLVMGILLASGLFAQANAFELVNQLDNDELETLSMSVSNFKVNLDSISLENIHKNDPQMARLILSEVLVDADLFNREGAELYLEELSDRDISKLFLSVMGNKMAMRANGSTVPT